MTTERDPSGITPGEWRWFERTRDEAACLVAGATTILHGYTDEHGERSGIIIENPKDADAIELVPEMIAALRAVLADLDGLMEESKGVAGLHLNGDLASWEWLESNNWLNGVDGAHRILAQLDNADAPRIAD